MDLAVLRSNLSKVASQLQSLTISDLNDCKWSIRKRILSELFSNSRRLEEFAVQIEQLSERYNAEVHSIKLNKLGRESRQECEQNFRTSFMRVFIDGLTEIQWPPALEAFADPFYSLMHDKDVFLGAVWFVLESCYAIAPLVPDAINKMQRNNDNRKSGSIVKEADPSGSDVVDESIYHGNTVESPSIVTMGSSQHWLPDEPDIALSSVDERPVNCKDRLEEISTMKKLVVTLQFQNSYLSKQLCQLQKAVMARDQVEEKVANLLCELEKRVTEIASTCTSSSNRSQSSLGSSAAATFSCDQTIVEASPNHEVSEEEHRQYRKVVDEEEAALRRASASKLPVGARGPITSTSTQKSRSLSSNRTDELTERKPTSFEPKTVPSGVIWTKLSESILALRLQWTDAQRAIHDAIMQDVELPIESSRFVVAQTAAAYRRILTPDPLNRDSKSSSFRGIGGSDVSINNESKRPSRRTSNSDSNVSSSSLASSASPRLKGPTRAPFSTAFETASSVRITPKNSSNQESLGVPSTMILLHQVYGLEPPISWSCGERNAANNSLKLDLNRIHSLQEQLLGISNSLWSLTNNLSSTGSIFDPCSCDEKTLNMAQSIQLVAQQAQTLSLSLAFLAHVSPLSFPANASFSSAGTGLELLIAEVAKLGTISSGKLQPFLDRVLSEQIALTRCLFQSREMLQQWTKQTRKLAPILQQFVRYGEETMQRCIGSLTPLSTSLSLVLDAYLEAEASRITQMGKPGEASANKGSNPNSSGALRVSPMDSLQRGYLGAEMAKLVSVLRTHSTSLKELTVQLTELSRNLSNEMVRHVCALEEHKKSLLKASDLCESAVSGH